MQANFAGRLNEPCPTLFRISPFEWIQLLPKLGVNSDRSISKPVLITFQLTPRAIFTLQESPPVWRTGRACAFPHFCRSSSFTHQVSAKVLPPSKGHEQRRALA